MSAAVELHLVALPDFPQVSSGDDLAALTAGALARAGLQLYADDVLVFAQKVISKAEGRRIDLATVVPSPKALELAQTVQKDPRLVELVLRESRRVVRFAKDVLIVEHRLGLIMANAGIDQSNVADPAGGEFALLLPEDPDASAARLRGRLGTLTGREPGVVISDSFGRPWRVGTVGVAIGCRRPSRWQPTRRLRVSTSQPVRIPRAGISSAVSDPLLPDGITTSQTRAMPLPSKAEPSSIARRMLIRVPRRSSRALGESTELATLQVLSSLRFVRALRSSICAASLPPRSELPQLFTLGPAPGRALGHASYTMPIRTSKVCTAVHR
jgi:coenzyme F420-0:L-glutamate ligase / coenzyme F420-1:gamma-L-glutamate ligase